ncbi:DUF4166 domain-containing protein [Pseudolysinimonas sp.]
MSSPWRLALGDRLDELDPALATYFGELPDGSVGRGSGVFDVVGTPRRWLHPLLAILGRAAIAFPGWAHDVPFEVRNEPRPRAIRATIVFDLPGGARIMRHEIRMTSRGLVDALGTRGWIEARLQADAVDGRLELTSTGTDLRLGRTRIPIPFAPRVRLTEQRHEDRQRVTLTLTAPVVGLIYTYRGSFTYRVEPA